MNALPASPLPRRILMTADTVGGVWTYALELAGALAHHDIFFEIATMGEPLSPAQWAEANALPNVRIHESGFKLEWMPDPWADLDAAGDWLLQLERETRPDLVHLNGFVHGALPFRAPVFAVGHSCVLSWWEAVKGEPAPREWNRYADAVRSGLRGAHLIAAPTQAMLSALSRHYGPFPNARQLLVLPNGREPTLFPCATPDRKEPLILAAGRVWDEAKNIAALENAAHGLPWEVLIAGDGGTPDSSGAATTRRLGQLPPPALARWLQRAAIYALPAKYEPFGLSILEAALAGCALVIGDIPSLREVWGDRAACYVDPNDDAALRNALCRLSGDLSERTRLSLSARERALHYTTRHMAGGYLAAYAAATNAA
ncbi:MAG: glycosyltransferase family 4 protein [Armatimonadota bacterium]